MRIFSFVTILFATTLLLASCGSKPATNQSQTGATTSLSGSQSSATPTLGSSGSVADASGSTVAKTVVSTGDTISVDYTGRLEDGTIFDSSREEDAKKSKSYSADRKYEPLTFTVGGGMMIKGFDQGVVGMHLGEKKTLTIEPKDGYGEEVKMHDREVPREVFQDTVTNTISLEALQDKVTQTVPKTAVPDIDTYTVGKTITTQDDRSYLIKDMTDTGVVLETDNSDHPFKGKDIAVGTTDTYKGNKVTITAVTETGVTIEMENNDRPFKDKELVLGLTEEYKGSQITVKAIGDKTVTITSPENPLAGKRLIFDVEIKSIK